MSLIVPMRCLVYSSCTLMGAIYELTGIILDPPIHLLLPLLPSPPLFLPIDCSTRVLIPLLQPFPFNLFQWITEGLRLFFNLWLTNDLFLLCKRKREERKLFKSSNRLCQYGSSRSLKNDDYQSIILQLHLPQVYNAESNIDALCVAPYFATLLRNFFVVLHDMLKSRSKVSEFYCVKSAKIHLMLFEFGGIFIDLSYACLKLVPNVENFQAMVGVLNYGQKGKEFMAHYMIIWEESILAIIAVYFCQ
ncbi:hypothetical protein Ahy_A03g015960 [Arachis hypogaea]|uniref:Poly(A) polymerase nucleotidyltransferase domain-containing protein n=1 Tax=Arachis hypogaea TaxID=3818 RepID=A0A445E1S4_ARAHY|nr:hypothetical protein Ahy_A03g015960 [Arachis hypogaea]